MSAEAIARLREALRHLSDDGEFVHVRAPDLRALLNRTSSAYELGITRGRRLERADIVADLRARAEQANFEATARLLNGEADRYERGEHKEGA